MSEARVAEDLSREGVQFAYEQHTLSYRDDKVHKYRPDFRLPNGVLVEVKGRFTATDRRKLLLVKQQNPAADIRLVFDRPHAPITKGSLTTYAGWCERNGFLWWAKTVPSHWCSS
jgi:hypothetical protein